MLVSDAWTPALEIMQNGVAYLLGERESNGESALSRDRNGGLTPVEVRQAERDDVARAKTEASQQKDDSAVSCADRRSDSRHSSPIEVI